MLNDKLYDMSKEDAEELELLLNTPSSELGSCRYKIADPDADDTDYKRILEIFKKYDVRYFFYNGGNDSMDTCNKISKYMQKVGYECRIMGVPKTIDNDLPLPEGVPTFGFMSAKEMGIHIGKVIKAEAATTQNWYVLMSMGREAGHLAFEIGKGIQSAMIVIPEMF